MKTLEIVVRYRDFDTDKAKDESGIVGEGLKFLNEFFAAYGYAETRTSTDARIGTINGHPCGQCVVQLGYVKESVPEQEPETEPQPQTTPPQAGPCDGDPKTCGQNPCCGGEPDSGSLYGFGQSGPRTNNQTSPSDQRTLLTVSERNGRVVIDCGPARG